MKISPQIIIRRIVALPAAFVGSYLMLIALVTLDQVSRSFTVDEVVFPILAMSFVLFGSLVTPVTERKFAAPLLYLLGAFLSWDVLSSLTEVDSVTPNYKPLIFTYVCGLLMTIVIVFWDNKSTK